MPLCLPTYFQRGLGFFCVCVTQNFPYLILKPPMDYRWDVITEAPLVNMGPISGPRHLFLRGPRSLTPLRTRPLPPVAAQKPGKCRKLEDTPQRKRIVHNQGQRKAPPASAPNQAPGHGVPQGQTKRTQVQQGGQARGRQRCGSSRGRTLAKETLWGQHRSPSDRQVSGLGTSSPGHNVSTWRSPAGPPERRVSGTPVWGSSEQHPSWAAGAPLT